MHPALLPTSDPAPQVNSSSYGELRAQVLLAHVCGHPAGIPSAVVATLDAWATDLMATAQGPALGLSVTGIPPAWMEVLAWSGIPLSKDGPMHWGEDICEQPVTVPQFRGAQLVLPPPATLAQLTSLALRPLRLLVTQRLQVRLQAATGLHVFLWANQAVIISRADIPLGGFLHGPDAGMRHTLSVAVGDAHVVRW